jgi:hypothetical protein
VLHRGRAKWGCGTYRNILLLLLVLGLGVLAGRQAGGGRSGEWSGDPVRRWGEMAKGSGERGQLLPVSADDGKGNGGGGAADDAALFKGSAMTRRGAVAALSYMACSGTYHARSAPSPGGRFGCFLCFGGAVASSRVLVSVGGRVALFVPACVQRIRERTCITCGELLLVLVVTYAFC